MRRLMVILLMAGLAAPVAEAQVGKVKELFSKNRTYNLGANPTVDAHPGSYHELREDLGWFQVTAYDKHTTLTIRFVPENTEVPFARDTDVEDAIDCNPQEPVLLRPGQVCALIARDDDREREYHLQISWTPDEDKRTWVVKVQVNMQVIKLD